MLDSTTASLERYLDLLSAREKLVASNIANADTPGYKTQDIDFQCELENMLSDQPPMTMEPDGLAQKPDGNNVSVDRETRMLAETAMRFDLASSMVMGQIKKINNAIDEGKNI